MTQKQIGTLVKKQRKLKGYTYYKLAKITGTEPVQIKSIETAGANYTIGILLKITSALDINIVALADAS